MKVKYMRPVDGFVGKLAKMVYYVDKITGAPLARAYVKPTMGENHYSMADRSSNIGKFYHSISQGYLTDLQNYSDRFNIMVLGHGTRVNSNSLLIKMLYSLKREVPSVNLVTITPQYAIDSGLPITTVRQAVEAGIIPIVPRYEELMNGIL